MLPEKREALGRSRGGYSTKIHVSVDGLGNPLELRITGGERNDITQAEELIENWQEEDTKVIGDKGYNTNKLIEKIGEDKAVIAKQAKVGMIWVARHSPTLVFQNLKATTLTYLAIFHLKGIGKNSEIMTNIYTKKGI